ncbi:MAG: AbrB/MazE/SpoVT family DNA-binding domain-containing protein [bacterium]|nr:AbrB/MazE/SpoVT family DNA-binding domain-containing protein [bacterium]
MAKIFRTGNSLAVVVPSRFVESLGLRSGDSVQVNSQVEKGRIVYQFSGVHQLSLPEDIFSRQKKGKMRGRT